MVTVGIIALALVASDATPTSLPPSLAPAAVAPVGHLELAPEVVERRWYGYQLIISDVVSLSMTFVGTALTVGEAQCAVFVSGGPVAGCNIHTGEAVLLTGATLFGVVPPIIHLLHGQYGKAAASFGLRVAIPVLTALALAGTSAAEAVVAVELLTAMVVDDAFLADEPVARPSRGRLETGDPTAPPYRGGSVGVGYSGTF